MSAITADGIRTFPHDQETFSPIKRLAKALSEKKTRVQLDLPPHSMKRLEDLKNVTEASSYAEVVRNAIRLYEAMVQETAAGRQFLVQDQSGTITPYKVFLGA